MKRTVLIAIFAFFCLKGGLWGLNFSGTLQRADSSEAPSRYTQSYTLSLTKDITSVMFAGSSVRYSRADDPEGLKEFWAPSGFFSVASDLLQLNLSATATKSKREGFQDLNGFTFTSSVGTLYKKTKASLLYSYNRRWTETDASKLATYSVDTRTHSGGASVSRSFRKGILKGLSLSYDYRFNEVRDEIQEGKTQSSYHFLKASYSRRWKKFSFSVYQGYSFSSTKYIFPEAAQRVIRMEVLLEFTNSTPTQLQEGDVFVLKVSELRELEGIDLYVDYTNLERLITEVVWNVYCNDTDTLLSANVTFPADFSSPQTCEYYRVEVVRIVGALKVDLPDPQFVGLYYIKQPYVKTENEAYDARLNVFFSPKRWFLLGYYFSFNRNESETRKSHRFSHTLTYSGNFGRFFRPTLGVTYSQESREEAKGSSENEFLSVSGSISSTPTKTINLGLMASSLSSWSEGELSSRSLNAMFYSKLDLYPDLSLKLSSSYLRSESGASKALRENLQSSAELNARLRPTVNLSVKGEYQKDLREEDIEAKRVSVSFNWTVSDVLSFSTHQAFRWETSGYFYSYSYGMALVLTEKTRLNGSFSGTKGIEDSNTLSLNFFWDLGPHFSFKVAYSRMIRGTESEWNVNTSLNLVF